MKYKGFVEIGYVGCKHEFEFEIDDKELATKFKTEKAREKHIEEIAFECVLECIDWNYKEDYGKEKV